MTDPSVSWPQIKAVFEATLDLPAAAREPLIAAAALAPAALAELRSLLAHHDQASTGADFLADNAAQALAGDEPAAALPASRLGQRLGAWQIVAALGTGGMGEVFEARRADGSYEGRAAVKLLKRGMDSAAVLQRFAQERQALARLAHPHIARLLDAGASPEGLPYFVLEFVQGQPIDEAARGLDLNTRLKLFLQLADAVAHAHRNLLVHRDLKPGNVLVDTQGQVKLLDFGIAKALDPLDAAGEAPQGSGGSATVGGFRPYTPHYASPEQVRGEPVSTATDIYSLGVLLYQMLTGTRPTGRRASTAAEAARSVLEDEPTRPSRLSPSEAVDPQWLATRKKLQGDLDNILLKALEKDPARRYASVDALAADVGHYLAGRPVSAHQASVAYVLGKFVRRHRAAVAAGALGTLGLALGLAAAVLQGQVLAALGLAGLAAGLGLALVQSRQAALARDLAQSRLQATRAIVSEIMVRHADAVHHLPGGLALKSELLQDTIRHLDALAAQAGNDAAFVAELALAHARLADVQGNASGLSLGEQGQARQHADKALALFVQAGGGAVGGAGAAGVQVRFWHAKTHYTLARLARAQGQPEEALAQFEKGVALLQAAPPALAADPQLRRALVNGLADMGQTLCATGMAQLDRPEQALQCLGQALALMQALKAGRQDADDAYVLARIHNIRAVVHEKHGRLQDAHEDCTQAAALLNENLDAQDQPDTTRQLTCVLALHNLAHLRSALGLTALACQAAAQALALLQRLQRENPDAQGMQHRAAIVEHGLAVALLQDGQPGAALAHLPPVIAWHAGQAAQTAQTAQPGAAGETQAAAVRRWGSALADQARCLLALGRADEAAGPALQAHTLLAPLAAEGAAGREVLEAWADTLDVLAALPAPPAQPGVEVTAPGASGAPGAADAAPWRIQAVQAWLRVQALGPLNAVHSARLAALQAAA